MKKIYTFAFAAALAMMGSAAMAQSEASLYGYIKVTEEPADWSGRYLIVYEADDDNDIAYVFNGALEAKDLDSKGNFFEVSNAYETIVGRVISGSDQVYAAVFEITRSAAEVEPAIYYIRSSSGYWIGYDNEEKGEPNLEYSNETPFENTISMEEGKTSVNIVGKVGNYQLRFNNDDGKQRFRYHEIGKKKGIKLYKEDGIVGPNTITTLSQEASAKQVYNLQGQRVDGMQKGLNIVDGKVILK